MSTTKVAEQVAAIKAATAKASQSKRAAEKFLKNAGIITVKATNTSIKLIKGR